VLNLRPLLPDEMIEGYIGHALTTNVLADVGALTARLTEIGGKTLDVTGGCSRFDEATIVAASRASGLTRERVFRHHTLRPLEVLLQPSWGRGNRVHKRISEWRVCRHCVEEDLAFWGASYWRRLHQLTGVTWCLKHGTSLLEYEKSCGLLVSPSEALAGGLLKDEALPGSWRTPAVERYAAIAVDLLENAVGPLSTARIVRLLLHRLKRKLNLLDRSIQRRVPLTREGRQMLLSDLPFTALPSDWISRYFPNCFEKSGASGLAPIDRLLLGRILRISAFHLAAVMTILWEDEGEATNDVLRASVVRHETFQ